MNYRKSYKRRISRKIMLISIRKERIITKTNFKERSSSKCLIFNMKNLKIEKVYVEKFALV